MKQYEFNNWVNFVRGVYPNFNPMSELALAAWRKALGDVSLQEAKEAVVIYSAETKHGFEPKPAQIREILDKLTTLRAKKEIEPPPKIYADVPEKCMSEDLERGECRHNLYVYRAAWELVLKNKVATINEGLEQVSLRKFGRIAEFPSCNDLKAKNLDKARLTLEETYQFLDMWEKKGCKL